jgi:hypothetical protein
VDNRGDGNTNDKAQRERGTRRDSCVEVAWGDEIESVNVLRGMRDRVDDTHWGGR